MIKDILHVFKGLGMLALIVIVVVLTLPISMRIAGFYTFDTGGSLAERLVSSGKPAWHCKKYMNVPWAIFGPTAKEQRKTCIYTYAQLTKDPTACELLMPSSYGLSCVGAATTFKRKCALERDRSTRGENFTAELSECMYGPPSTSQHNCCIVSKARFVLGFNSCEGITDADMLDQCIHGLAIKNSDPSYCNNIAHENLRIACEVRAKAMQKYPGICDGCVPAIHESEI